MIGQYSEERFKTSSEPEATDKPVYNSELETNPIVDESLEYEAENMEIESDDVYIGPDLTVEPMPEDVSTWKPIPAFEVMANADAIEKPVYDSEIEANPIVDETLEYEAEKFETEADDVYIGPDLTVEPMPEDVPTWKPIPAVEVMAKAEAIETPVQEMTAAASYLNMKPESTTNLLLREDSEHFRTRWNEIQQKFVDEPRDAVQQADALVSEVVDQITRMFATEHGTLEGQWKQGNDVSTEDLRKALQHYRSFFNRLVV